MSDKIYHCKYQLDSEYGEFKEAEHEPPKGLTDAFMFISLLRKGGQIEEGVKSTTIFSFDGQNGGGPIPDTELFKIWTIFAYELSVSSDCEHWQKVLASRAFRAFENGERKIRRKERSGLKRLAKSIYRRLTFWFRCVGRLFGKM